MFKSLFLLNIYTFLLLLKIYNIEKDYELWSIGAQIDVTAFDVTLFAVIQLSDFHYSIFTVASTFTRFWKDFSSIRNAKNLNYSER